MSDEGLPFKVVRTNAQTATRPTRARLPWCLEEYRAGHHDLTRLRRVWPRGVARDLRIAPAIGVAALLDGGSEGNGRRDEKTALDLDR